MSDFDKALVLEVLSQIQKSARTILKRFEPIQSAEDFTVSEAGLEKLDAICMQLIAIGESLKNLDKITNQSLLPQYPQIDWKRAKGLRDIISHHYFDLNAEAIYEVCESQIETLAQTIEQIIKDLS
ncbi:MAG: DUF86 domain-containing protein [Deltaproteobacteria bacterium]|nr:DUF86 domain-containing protein [Deltaproteobacteria bacterium]